MQKYVVDPLTKHCGLTVHGFFFFLPLQKKAEEMGSLNFLSLRKKLILIQNFIFSFFS